MIFTSVCMGILFLVLIIGITGKMNRSVELQCNLAAVLEESMGDVMGGGGYTIRNEEELAAVVMEGLAMRLDTDSELTVDIHKADVEKGLLSVEVSEDYGHLDGTHGKISCERTVILDSCMENYLKTCRVEFYTDKESMTLGENCYKEYTILEGDEINEPVTPEKEGKEFVGWRDKNDYYADFSVGVYQDVSYYAEWR